MINENFVILGALLNFGGGISYLIDTIKGKIQPNKVSWFIWSVAPLMTFAAEIQQGVGIHASVTFVAGFGPLLVFIGSFVNKKSYWKISKLDIACGVLSLLGLVLWYITKAPNVAIIFGILADGLAGVPTIIKSYYFPESESYQVYLFAGISGIIALLATKTWNLAHVGFPIYILLICLILVLLIKFKLGKIIQKRFAAAEV